MGQKYAIGRPINGISLNGDEMLLDDNNEVMEFESISAATQFLLDHGESLKNLHLYNRYELIPLCNECDSDEILSDAWAIWGDGEWEFHSVQDKKYCKQCDKYVDADLRWDKC